MVQSHKYDEYREDRTRYSADLLVNHTTTMGYLNVYVAIQKWIVNGSGMSKARLAGNQEKYGTQRDVNSLLPAVGLIYSPAIYFIYIIYKCRYFAHDSTVKVTFPDRSREIYACDVVWGYFSLIGILHPSPSW